MVTGTQINVKSRIEASKLISTAPRTKVCHFCWCCRQSCKKQERNWSTFFKSFWKIKSSMASVVIKLLSCFLYCFLSPFFVHIFSSTLRFMISFIIDMNFQPFFWVTTNICVFRIARILVLTGEFWVPSSSAIRRRLQTSVVGKFPEKSMHFLSPTPPLYRSAFF